MLLMPGMTEEEQKKAGEAYVQSQKDMARRFGVRGQNTSNGKWLSANEAAEAQYLEKKNPGRYREKYGKKKGGFSGGGKQTPPWMKKGGRPGVGYIDDDRKDPYFDEKNPGYGRGETVIPDGRQVPRGDYIPGKLREIPGEIRLDPGELARFPDQKPIQIKNWNFLDQNSDFVKEAKKRYWAEKEASGQNYETMDMVMDPVSGFSGSGAFINWLKRQPEYEQHIKNRIAAGEYDPNSPIPKLMDMLGGGLGGYDLMKALGGSGGGNVYPQGGSRPGPGSNGQYWW